MENKLTTDQKIKTFKTNINKICFETSSQCNRKCSYCPQSIVSRPNIVMDKLVLLKILTNIQKINNDITYIKLNIYNEPLLHFEDLIQKIYLINHFYPKAITYFNTNGDLLTIEKLDKLNQTSINKIIISHHYDGNWEYNKVNNYIQETISKFDLKIINTYHNNSEITIYTKYKKINIELKSKDYLNTGSSRNGILQNITFNNYIRKDKCNIPLNELHISYDGTVYPCNQFYHGYKPHEKYICGNALYDNIVDIYFNSIFCNMRNCALQINGICKDCRN